MSTNLSEPLDSSESYEVAANDTELDPLDDNPVDVAGTWWWDLDSSTLWLLAVLGWLALLALLLFNFHMCIRCAAGLNSTLCGVFNDVVFYVFGWIASPGCRQCMSAADREPPAKYWCNSTAMDLRTGFEPSPFCCLIDVFHENLERNLGLTKKKLDLFENRDGDNTVDLSVKHENSSLGPKENVEGQSEVANGNCLLNKEKTLFVKEKRSHHRKESHFEMNDNVQYQVIDEQNDYVDSYMGNARNSSKKLSKKMYLQTVPEDHPCPMNVGSESSDVEMEKPAGGDVFVDVEVDVPEPSDVEMEKPAGGDVFLDVDLREVEDVPEAEIFI